MKQGVRLLVVALAVLMAVAAPATAAPKGHGFHGSVDGWESGFLPGPLIPEGRCPEGTGWMLFSDGGGEAEGYGSFSFSAGHCSRVVAPIPGGAQGKMAAGVMVLDFGEGDVLTLGYWGSWKYIGDLDTGEGKAKAQQSYEVLEGAGIFEGAKGHGSMNGVFDFHRVLFDIRGSLVLD